VVNHDHAAHAHEMDDNLLHYEKLIKLACETPLITLPLDIEDKLKL